MDYHDPKHPVWSIGKTLIVLITLTLTLWLNAEHFDETETRTVITMFFAFLGVEGFSGFLAGKTQKRE